MILALAQLNPVVGDIEGNVARILDALERAERAAADVLLVPELAVIGYPPKDLLLDAAFIEQNAAAVERIARRCTRLAALVGFAEPNPEPAGRRLFNSAAVCREGRVAGVHRKTLLPTYDVFDESRYFEPAAARACCSLTDRKGRSIPFGITICEDVWNDEALIRRPLYHSNPLTDLTAAGARWIVNVSASPFDADKDVYRRELFSHQARRCGVPLACANQIGANDDLVFDGASAVFDRDGTLVARARAFEEDLLIVDTDALPDGRVEPYPDRIESIHRALVLGTRDYVRKCGFRRVVLGLSGGVDSALTAVIAVEALGPAAVHGIAMPSRYSSDHSVEDARRLAENLGVAFDVVPIDAVHAAAEDCLARAFGAPPAGVAAENIQARLRANVLMAVSNRDGALLLTTGNKSELAVGYTTLYGDMCGGLAVLSDVPKTTVYELARACNRRAGRAVIPERTLTKPPSAELRPDQTDQDTLPPYDVLDAILHAYVEQQQSAHEIIAAGHDASVVRDVIARVNCNEYKRKQAPPGIKVTTRAFGTGRRMPIAARYPSTRNSE